MKFTNQFCHCHQPKMAIIPFLLLMGENSRPQTPSFGGSGWVMLFRGSPAPACRARVRAPSAPHERDDLRVVSFFIMIIRKQLSAKTPPCMGAEACLLRPESTPMCSAVHSGRGSRAFYGQKARLCARGHARGIFTGNHNNWII